MCFAQRVYDEDRVVVGTAIVAERERKFSLCLFNYALPLSHAVTSTLHDDRTVYEGGREGCGVWGEESPHVLLQLPPSRGEN
jgi:hypothetical protein